MAGALSDRYTTRDSDIGFGSSSPTCHPANLMTAVSTLTWKNILLYKSIQSSRVMRESPISGNIGRDSDLSPLLAVALGQRMERVRG